MPDDNQDRVGELISAELRGNLIALLGDRLAAGEPMIAPVQFQKAMEEDYQAISVVLPSEPIKAQLAEIFLEVVQGMSASTDRARYRKLDDSLGIGDGAKKWLEYSGHSDRMTKYCATISAARSGAMGVVEG